MSQTRTYATHSDRRPALVQAEASPHAMPLAGVRRSFRSAPQSVSGFIAAALEPGLNAAMLLAAHLINEVELSQASMALLPLVMFLSFPGIDRFRDGPWTAAADIVLSWVWLLFQLALIGYATGSLELYDWRVLLGWALATPVFHWSAVMAGRQVLVRRAQRKRAIRRSVIIGAGRLAVSVAQALRSRHDASTEVCGCFDDRTGARLDDQIASLRLGGLADVADYVRRHGVDAVYITLPLGSQPRIVALMEALQGTTASLFLVPDLFGISIIQGRLQDVNGLPVVGLCETPFTGVNEAVKRASDVVFATLILTLVAPLMLLMALAVKHSSPGPVIFRQRRNGLGGEQIVVYKFRSMRSLDDGQVVLERQYRYPMQRAMIEFPAGKLDAGEGALACAQRELLEETGYVAREWARAGLLNPGISYSTEFIDIWFARGLTLTERKLDEGEFLDVFTASPQQLMQWCHDGQVTDGKTLTGALWLQNMLSGTWALDWQTT